MFSSPDTVSLFNLDKRIHELIVSKRNRDVSIQIANALEYREYQFFERVMVDVSQDLLKLILLGTDDFWLVSPDGRVLRGSSLFVEYVAKQKGHPVRTEYEMAAPGWEWDWLFFEYPTFLLTAKYWDRFGKRVLMGADAIDEEWIPIVVDRIRQFEGWSLCVEQSSYPASIAELLDVAQNRETVNSQSISKRRGRPPSGAKHEYFKRYPKGKPVDVSFDAIAAELTDAGFPISARMLQNYEKSR